MLAAVPLIRTVQMQRPVHTPEGGAGGGQCLGPARRSQAGSCCLHTLGTAEAMLGACSVLFFKDTNVSRRIIGLPVQEVT